MTVEPWGRARVVRLRRSELRPLDRTVPGDPSQAAFWVVAGVVVPGSRVTVDRVHLGAERIGFVHVLARMGADVVVHDGGRHRLADGYALGAGGTTVEADEIPSLDEVPILAVAALVAEGPTRFRDVGELRVKESDRLAGTVRLVQAFGGPPGSRATTWWSRAGPACPRDRPRRGRPPDGHGRGGGRSGLRRRRVTEITGWDAVATSYPAFAGTFARLGGESP